VAPLAPPRWRAREHPFPRHGGLARLLGGARERRARFLDLPLPRDMTALALLVGCAVACRVGEVHGDAPLVSWTAAGPARQRDLSGTVRPAIARRGRRPASCCSLPACGRRQPWYGHGRVGHRAVVGGTHAACCCVLRSVSSGPV
jgi:hypothetical protein